MKKQKPTSSFSRSVGGAQGVYGINMTSQQLNRGNSQGVVNPISTAASSRFGTQGTPDPEGNTGTPSAAPVAKSGKS
jgi:hypothetical protein